MTEPDPIRDLRQHLENLTPPATLAQRILEQRPEVPRRSPRWPVALAASAVLAAALWLVAPPAELPGEPSGELKRALPVAQDLPASAHFVVARQQVPVRTFSVTSGPSTRMVEASVITDRRGVRQAIYLHPHPAR